MDESQGKAPPFYRASDVIQEPQSHDTTMTEVALHLCLFASSGVSLQADLIFVKNNIYYLRQNCENGLK